MSLSSPPPPPSERRTTLTASVRPEIVSAIEEIARHKNLSRSRVVENALLKYLEEEEHGR